MQQQGVFAPGYRALSTGILASITAVAVEGLAVATILPMTAADLGGYDAYGWAFSAFMLASLLGAVATGQAADGRSAVGPTRLVFVAFGLGSLVAGLAPAWPVLLLGRVLQGLGGGGLVAIAYLAVARGYPERLRPRLLALTSTAWVVPALVAPALAGQVAEHASWRLVFLGLLPLLACGAALVLPALGQLNVTSPAPGQPGRLRAAGRLAAGLGLMLWAFGLGVIGPTLLVAGFGAVLAAPALRGRLPEGTPRLRPGLPAAVATRGLLAFGFFGADALVPLGLATLRDLPPTAVGLAVTASALTWTAGSWLQDRAEARAAWTWFSRSARARVGLVLLGLSIGAVGIAILSPEVPAVLGVVAWGIAGLGTGLAYSSTTLVALGQAPAGQEGATSASLQLAETVGTAAGTGAVGALLALAPHVQHEVADGIWWGLLLTAGVTLLGLVPAARMAARPVPTRFLRKQLPMGEAA